MTFLESMKNRYTTKNYDQTKKISDSEISQLKEILHLSPSSINSQPWKFTFVSDYDVKDQLSKSSFFNEPKVKNASHVVVFSIQADVEKFETQLKGNTNELAFGFFEQFIKPQPEEQIKAWMTHQLYISLGVFLSACANMEIDSTAMEGINKPEYASILKLENQEPVFAVAIGYRAEDDFNQLSKKPKNRIEISKIVETK